MFKDILLSVSTANEFSPLKNFLQAIIKDENMLIYTVDKNGNIECTKVGLDKVKIMKSRGKIPLVAYDINKEIKEIRIEPHYLDFG